MFTPGSVYGAPIQNQHPMKFELDFRFVSGGCEFRIYSSGRQEEDNSNSLDQLAGELSGVVDGYVRTLTGEMSGHN